MIILIKKMKMGNCIFNPSNSLFLTPTVPYEVEKIIDSLDINKSTGPNSVTIYFLKTFKSFSPFGYPS